jgi:uncharacterized protein
MCLYVGKSKREVSALLNRPPVSHCLLVMGHGAGAGMRHRTMEAICDKLAQVSIATFRYQFPYMERGERRPDPQPVLLATVRAAIASAGQAAPDLPVFAGGKSMGGRMTSLAAADEALPGIRGIVFFGFPLHPSGRPGTDRAKHLEKVSVPMLFLQGERDRLAEIELIREVTDHLGPQATLQVMGDADHSFHVPKRSGRTDGEVLAELATIVRVWIDAITSQAIRG